MSDTAGRWASFRLLLLPASARCRFNHSGREAADLSMCIPSRGRERRPLPHNPISDSLDVDFLVTNTKWEER